MIAKIFDVDSKRVTINENTLLIPEFKAVVDEYKDPIPALCYIYYLCDVSSPYANLPEDTKDQMLLSDFPGEYTPEDEVVREAIAKAKLLYRTPTSRLLDGLRSMVDKLAQYCEDAAITDGRDGNLTAVQAMLKGVGRMALEMKQVEKIVEEEVNSARGNSEIGYDEIL